MNRPKKYIRLNDRIIENPKAKNLDLKGEIPFGSVAEYCGFPEDDYIGSLLDEIVIVSDHGYRYMPTHDVTLRPEDYRHGLTAQAITHLEYLREKEKKENYYGLMTPPVYTCYGIIQKDNRTFGIVAKFNLEEMRWELI